MTARILDCTEEEYFRDPCARPSLSQSTANTLLTKSPLHAWHEHPRLGGVARTSTKAMAAGSLVDILLLGGISRVEVLDFGNYTTKVAREAKEAAIEAGKIPALTKELAAAFKVRDSIRENLKALGIELSGRSQVAIEWEESSVHGDVLCRGKMDHVIFDQGKVYDLKIVNSAHPDAIKRKVLDFGYHVQRAAYVSAVSKLRPDLAGRVDFVLLFVEGEPPYASTPVRLAGTFRELGERQWERACATWELCRSTDVWPGYADSVVGIDAPPWALAREAENAAAS